MKIISSFAKTVFVPLFNIFGMFPLCFYIVKKVSNNEKFEFEYNKILYCSLFSLGFFAYSYLTIIIGFLFKQVIKGYKTEDGNVSEYANNGFQFFLLTMGLTYYLCTYQKDFVVELVKDHLTLLLVLDVLGVLFSIYICYVGHDFEPKNTDSENEVMLKKFYKEERKREDKEGGLFEYHFLFRFYRGMRYNTSILGVDVKQLTNCRFGCGLWLVLLWFYYTYSVEIKAQGNYVLLFVNIIQTLYLGKFYWLEYGYFSTLDIILDRVGYYINYGCISFVPTLYTLNSYNLAHNLVTTDPHMLYFLFGLSLLFLILNYYMDYQKLCFQLYRKDVLDKADPSKFGTILQTITKYGSVFYIKSKEGWTWIEEERDGVRSKLLLTGLWGFIKKPNYLFELLLTFTYAFMGLFLSNYNLVHCYSFSYFTFLFFLLIHRCYRDNSKCSSKYGNLWKVYSEEVPSFIIYGVF